MAKEDEEIKEALDKLEEISSDEEKIRIAELREKYILDQNSNIYVAEQRGIEQGKANKTKEIAKEMKEKNIPIETIVEVTGLTIEEIERLKL